MSRRRRVARAWHSEERALLILESIEEYAIFMLDPEGHVESWNAGAERIKGYRADEILGHHFGVFYLPEDAAAGKPDAALKEARERGRYEEEGWRVRKDGSRFWASVVISVMRDASGRVEGFSKVTRDLTERREAQEALRRAEERYRVLVETVQDYAIFRLDPDGTVASWNSGAERIKGYRADEIVGRHFSAFYPPEDIAAGKPEALLQAARERGRHEQEGWRVRKDGSRFWADIVVTALHTPSGELWGFVKVTRDLTARHAAEADRLRRAQAEEAVRLRDEFLSIASHELKTPLTALHMELHSIPRSFPELDPRLARKVDRATRSADRLGTLMSDLLESSRLATQHYQLDRQPFLLAEAVRDVLEHFAEPAVEAGCRVTLRVESAAQGVWDRSRLQQVVTNLLSNAIKYGAGAPVEVRVAVDGTEAVLTVEDGGPGIPDDALSRIFDRFERAVPVRHYGGLGLGLYVSREIVAAHGGSIAAQNVPGGGARFTVRLPLAPGDGFDVAS
jgi:PAS domain S-box-containing protein